MSNHASDCAFLRFCDGLRGRCTCGGSAATILRRAARWWRCHVQCRVCCHAICRCEPDDGMYGDWRDRPGNYGE